MTTGEHAGDAPPTEGSAAIDAAISRHPNWRGAILASLRGLIREADPEVVEDVKPTPRSSRT